MKRKLFSRIAGALALTLVLAACGGGEEPEAAPEGELEPLELSFTYLRTTALVALVADQQGFFVEEGLDVDLIETETGGAALEAMMGGSTDVTQAADARLPQTLAEGLPVVGIGVNNTGYSGSLVVAADNDAVNDWSDCVGLRVAAQVGSGAHTVWIQYVTEHLGLSVDDFEVVSLSVPDMAGALHGGSVDCALMWQPHVARAAEEGLTRVVMQPHEIAEPLGVLYPFVLIAHEEVVAEKAEALQRFLNAIRRSQLWIQDNEAEAKEILHAFIGDVSDDVLEAIYNEVEYEKLVIDDDVVADLTSRAETLAAESGGEIPDLMAGIDNSFAENAVNEFG